MGLVLGAFDGMAIAEQTLQDVLLAPAVLDGKALVFVSLVKCGHPVAGCRLVGDGIDHQIAIGDVEGAGIGEMADDGLGLELDRVGAGLADLVVAETDNPALLGAAVIDGGGQPCDWLFVATSVAQHDDFHRLHR